MPIVSNIKNILADLFKGKVSTMGIVSPGIVVYIVILLVIYIANHNCVERDMRRISDLKEQIKDLRYESITVSSELMNMSKQSEILRRVKKVGLELKELTEPPRIIHR